MRRPEANKIGALYTQLIDEALRFGIAEVYARDSRAGTHEVAATRQQQGVRQQRLVAKSPVLQMATRSLAISLTII